MAAKEFPLAVVIRAVDRVTGPLRGATNAISRFGSRIRAEGRGVAEKLGLPVLTRAAGKLGGSLVALGRRIALVSGAIAAMGAAATAAAWRLVEAFAAAGDEVAKTADRLGIGIERFQELRYAAGQSGIEADKFTMAMTKLNTNVGLAARGTGEAGKVFEALGINVRDSEGRVRSIGDLLPELADKFKMIEEPAVAAAAAAALFGERNGSKMLTLLREGSTGIEELSAQARRLGLIIGEDAARQGEVFGDTMDDLKLAITGVRNIIGTALIPRLIELAKQFTDLVVQNQGRIKAFFDSFAANLPGYIENAIAFLKDLRAAVQPVIDAVSWLVDKFGGANVALAALGTVIAAVLLPPLVALTSALWAVGAAILGTPIGWIIAGVAALVAGLVYLYNEFEEVRIVIDAIGRALKWFFMNFTPLGLLIRDWDKVTKGFSWAWSILKAIGRVVAWVFMNFTPLGLVIKNWDTLSVGLGWVWEKLKALGEIVAWVFLNFTPIGQLIQNWDAVSAAIDRVMAVLSDLWENIRVGFDEAIGWVSDFGDTLSDMVPDWVKEMFSGDTEVSVAGARPQDVARVARDGQDGEVRVRVDLGNLPPGTKTRTETMGRPNFELNQGFAMGLPG